MPANAPILGKFDQDPRVHFDKTAGTWQYEDDETGLEYEWNGKVWLPVLDQELLKAQQAAYSVQGVDENTPAAPVIAREERRNKKRKKGEVDYTTNASDRQAPVASTSTKPAPQLSAPKRTAVWVTSLPPNTTVSLLASVFSKAGVLLIGDDGEPRIKLYYDDDGRFKGEALIMYFKEGSVDLAITLLDDTELELGAGFGNMRVRVAEYDKSQNKDNGKKDGDGDEKKNGTEGAENVDPAVGKEKKKLAFEEKAKMSKRIKTMQNKLTWHSDSDSDDPGAPVDGAPAPGASRFNRVVVLKGMFTLEDLEKDASLLLELKEEVREEAETLGQVTSIVLYDKEEDGVMTIKFKDAVSAQACVLKMHGRFFDGRKIQATIFDGRERFSKSGPGNIGDDDKEERERLDSFAQWLVDGEE